MEFDGSSARARRTVLFVAYYFPPLGGGGVQRSLSFVRHLPASDYDPVLVTRPAEGAPEWGPVDETLRRRLEAQPRIVRVPGPEPARSSGWPGRRERWLRRPSAFARWWRAGILTAALEEARRADVLFASMSPFETAAGVAQLSRSSGTPWVADLRDPWALDDWLVYPTALHRRLELRQMRRDLSSAAAIVMNTPESARALLAAAPELAAVPVVTITNGFDAEEFGSAARDDEQAPRRFRIVHAGHSHSDDERRRVRVVRSVLGGSVRGLNTSTRSHLYLLRAVQDLLARRPELRELVEVHLVGRVSHRDAAALGASGVVVHGYLSHEQTLGALRGADLLFLPMHDLGGSRRARIVPGKTYEYLAAGPPILAAVPAGDARDLLEAAGHADICAPSDFQAQSRAIERRVDAWLDGAPAPQADPRVVRRFERRRLTRDLADLFDLVLETGAPGASESADRFRDQLSPSEEVVL
jgi:glycosyltransferase involved in cell wall biosynthesis